MKKFKKCYRTMTADNYEPTNCKGEACIAWTKVGDTYTCVFVANATLSAARNLLKLIQQKKQETREDDTDGDDNTGQPQGGQRGPISSKADRTQDGVSGADQEDTKKTPEGEGPRHVVESASVSSFPGVVVSGAAITSEALTSGPVTVDSKGSKINLSVEPDNGEQDDSGGVESKSFKNPRQQEEDFKTPGGPGVVAVDIDKAYSQPTINPPTEDLKTDPA